MANELPPGVAETAVGAAMMRAAESERADALFVDPFAAAFVAAVPPIFEDGPTADDDPGLASLEAAFEEVVAVRTRFFDDFASAAAADGIGQIIIVGAGLDTRAFRLEWPAGPPVLHLFELDVPEVLQFKDEVLGSVGAQPRCPRIPVSVDLRDEQWPARLIEHGLAPTRRSAWIIEGLVPYLTPEDAERLLDAVTGLSSPGSRVALDHPVLREAQEMVAMDDITSMWRGGFARDVAGWLGERGWRAETINGSELSEQLGRSASDMHGAFIAATRSGESDRARGPRR